jgi:hypothetical protein
MEYLKEAVDTFIPTRFDVTKVYDSHSGNHKTAVLNALNTGQHLVNHADHGNWNYLGTGDRNHGWGINNNDVYLLTNTDKTSIVVSLSCHSLEINQNDCIGEYFVFKRPQRG